MQLVRIVWVANLDLAELFFLRLIGQHSIVCRIVSLTATPDGICRVEVRVGSTRVTVEAADWPIASRTAVKW